MSDFKQAIKWMKEGKKVRREYWGNKELCGYINTGTNWIHFKDKDGPSTARFLNDIKSLEATDWEIYCEEHDWKTTLDHNLACDMKECSNCGKREILPKPKESLSDADKYNVHGQHFIDLKKTKEKIQNAQKRLKEIWRKNYYKYRDDVATGPFIEDIKQIFKEEFGKDLL